MIEHKRQMLDTFVDLADTLASDYDVHEFLRMLVERTAESLSVTTGGVMLEGPEGRLRLAVGLSPEMKDLEQAEIDNEDGPCHEAYRTGEPVIANDLEHSDFVERWPTVIERILALNLRAVYAFPLRLRDDRIGALNMYRDSPGEFAADEIRAAQAFADFAAVGILQQRQVTDAERRAEQLQYALGSRIVIEQAKGIVSARRDISIDEAFDVLRGHARSRNLKIHEVARTVIDNGPNAIEGLTVVQATLETTDALE